MRKLKELTSKRNKTDSDLELIADVEWLGSWYYRNNEVEFAISQNSIVLGDHGEAVMPMSNLLSTLIAAAKKNKLGNQFKSGVFIEDDATLLYSPKKSIAQALTDRDLRYQSMERVQSAKVLRTRPYLKTWEFDFTVNYDDTIVTQSQIEQSLDIGGRLIGFCDRRPTNGRFKAEILNGKK